MASDEREAKKQKVQEKSEAEEAQQSTVANALSQESSQQLEQTHNKLHELQKKHDRERLELEQRLQREKLPVLRERASLLSSAINHFWSTAIRNFQPLASMISSENDKQLVDSITHVDFDSYVDKSPSAESEQTQTTNITLSLQENNGIFDGTTVQQTLKRVLDTEGNETKVSVSPSYPKLKINEQDLRKSDLIRVLTREENISAESIEDSEETYVSQLFEMLFNEPIEAYDGACATPLSLSFLYHHMTRLASVAKTFSHDLFLWTCRAPIRRS